MPVAASSGTGSIHLDRAAPAVARRGPLGHPAVLLVLAGTVLFGAYALGYIPEVGSLIEGAIHSSQTSRFSALNPAIYGIGGLVAFLLLLSVLRSFELLFQKTRKPVPLKPRTLKPLALFIEEAAVSEISLRVARESYQLLQPYYQRVMSIALTDDLRVDLRLAEEQISVLTAKLLACCDRRDTASETNATLGLVTVFDMLRYVETAGPMHVERSSGMRERSTDSSRGLPAMQSHNPSSAQRKALHAAALQAIESRSLRSTQPPDLNRRSSDYEGPRRRATDDCPEPLHKGPFRRSTDSHAFEARTASAERKVQGMPTPSALRANRIDPDSLSPVDQRIPTKEARAESGALRISATTSNRQY